MDDIARNNAHELLMNSLRSVQELLSDPLVQEVMINAPNDVWVERAGVGISKTDICISDVEIRSTIRLLASLEDKDVRDKGKDSHCRCAHNGVPIRRSNEADLAQWAIHFHPQAQPSPPWT